jgi:transketolase
MRERLSELLVSTASDDEQFLVLSGDHGYSLFDALRSDHPSRFINVGVAEQNMIGLAAGLVRTGFRPCVYGLAAFVPIRVLEQIKLDLCFSRLPVILLGDGAGLVYSTLGVSHQCGEDIACLRSLPNIAIYSPCDEHELVACWTEARRSDVPSYIRLGKADRPPVHGGSPGDTSPLFTSGHEIRPGDAVVVSTGSMVSVCTDWCRSHGVSCISVPRLKPFPTGLIALLEPSRHVVVVEEHCRTGGLWSALVEYREAMRTDGRSSARITSVSLRNEFTHTCGSYQHALSEHDMGDERVRERLRASVFETA